MIRAALCGFVFLDILLTDFVDLGRLPVTVIRPTGAMKFLPWSFYDILVTPRGMLILKMLLLISLAAATLGYFTSVSMKCAAVLFLFYQGLLRSFGHFNHDEMPVVYMFFVMAFTPSGDGFSLDRVFRGGRARAGDIVYGYPILLMRVLLAWSYFSSALIKLRVTGLAYFNPDNLPTLSILHSLDNLHDTHFRLAFWLPRARPVMTVAIVLVLLWEFLFPLALFSKTARRIILSAGVVFHIGTLLFMNVFFPYHLAAYVVFIDWPRLASQVKGSGLFQSLSGYFEGRFRSRPKSEPGSNLERNHPASAVLAIVPSTGQTRCSNLSSTGKMTASP